MRERVATNLARIAMLACVAMLAAAYPAEEGPRAEEPATSAAQPSVFFEPNEGQFAPQTRFATRAAGYALELRPNEAILTVGGAPGPDSRGSRAARPIDTPSRYGRSEEAAPEVHRVRMRWLGAEPVPEIVGLRPRRSSSGYFVGNDPAAWHRDVPHFGRVRYEGVYPGIDLVFHARRGALEYDFVVAPGFDPDVIRLEFDGADEVRIDDAGNLVLAIGSDEVLQPAPVIFQRNGGRRVPIQGRFVQLATEEIGFEVDDYDTTSTLVIDPKILFSTFFGGNDGDSAASVAVDKAGNVYVAGTTLSSDLPGKRGHDGTDNGNGDAFIALYNKRGKLQRITYYGGSDIELLFNLRLNENVALTAPAADGARAAGGVVYIVGSTGSADLPSVDSVQGFVGGSFGAHDAFVAVFTSDLKQLVMSTPLGHNGNDTAIDVATDDSGRAYVVGDTSSGKFPTVRATQKRHAGKGDDLDGFVAVLEPAAGNLAASSAPWSLVFSTFLGGADLDFPIAVAVDVAGEVVVVGATLSRNFPTVDALQNAYGGVSDGFLTRYDLSPITSPVARPGAAPSMVSSTFYGGSKDDSLHDVVVDEQGRVYAVGLSGSPDFPVTSPLQQELRGEFDGVVVAFDTPATTAASAGALVPFLSSYWGGNGFESLDSLAIDNRGVLHIAALIDSSDFPLVRPIQKQQRGDFDAGVVRIDPGARATAPGRVARVLFSSYLGSSGTDFPAGIAADKKGASYIVGQTSGANFPAKKAAQKNLRGFDDAFLTKIKR